MAALLIIGFEKSAKSESRSSWMSVRVHCTTTISRQIFVLDLYFFLNHRLRMVSSDFESFSRICHKMHLCLESVSISVFSSKICQHICFFGLESVSILYFLSRIC